VGEAHCPPPDLGVLEQIARRVLWLAVRMVDAANRDRDTGDGVGVGGHQASSASLVPAMTALYFAHLGRNDKVSVKPHASPVFHAIQYLLGRLDRSYLTRLRARGGLQAYPSRTRDPDRVDFSTGSLGLGPAAPLFAALTRRYVDDISAPGSGAGSSRSWATRSWTRGVSGKRSPSRPRLGWGTSSGSSTTTASRWTGSCPSSGARQRKALFTSAGWHVCEIWPGGACAGGSGSTPRRRWPARSIWRSPTTDIPDAELAPLLQDFGGHDLATLLEAYAECDSVHDRPSVIFAQTVKVWGLPTAWHPRNHYALLTKAQIDDLRVSLGISGDAEWDRFSDESDAGRWCRARAAQLGQPSPASRPPIRIPDQVLRPVAPR
jgi:pyruvate dehydrogenase E1 component